ncbi:MAG: hypothetical protein AAB772_00670, partial [Patescibacteria group bacterium]
MNKNILTAVIVVLVFVVGSVGYFVFQNFAFFELQQSVNAGIKEKSEKEFPFGLSNPYEQKDYEIKNALPAIIKDLG